jgi:3-hydroxyacyl-CoA dehydrogenase/enoyl-CoA hydratase/carnithine racemase
LAETEFRLQRAGEVALVTIDNDEDWTKPTFFSRGALESLARILDELERGSYAAMVLTGKPFVFAAGADITEFPGVAREAAVEGSRAGHELFGRIAALPFPTVAAVNGAALGGGVEIALHCSARTVASSVRHFALPEVFLGLFPAWGGTQLVPRLAGPAAAVTFVVDNPLKQNRMLDAAKALELGLVDRLLEPAEFVDESIRFALELASGSEPLTRTAPDWTELETVMRRARARVDDVVHGAAPAPYVALDLIEGAATWTLEEGYRREEEAIGELLPGRQAQASIYAFNLVERRAKRPPRNFPAAAPRRVEHVGIVGAGLMARQLAALFVRRLEVPVVIRDLSQEIVDEALDQIRAEVGARKPFLATLVSGGTGWDGWERCDLVLEAVVEELDVKKQVFAELRERAPGAILATNTSSLSVAEMGAEVGMHFFNPVAVLPLVEVVRHDETSDEALATTWEVARKLRKRPVLVADAPAFVVNRLLTRMTTVIMDALEHGNTADEVDEALLALGLPMAPSVLLQMVGPRVAYHVLETLHDAYPERFPLSPTLAGYAAGRDEIVAAADERRRSSEEIRADALAAIGDEVRHLLEEGVVAEAADVDTCLILGAGWPFFMGGVTKHLDQTGVSERLFGRPLAEMGAAATA